MTIHQDGYIAISFDIKKGQAPGMQVRLLGEYDGRKDYLVVFKKGDEAFAGLHEFAEKYEVKSASFTAIGAANKIILGWISPDKKRYKNIAPEGQVEIGSMMGNIALYNGKSVVHAHAVVTASDGTTRSGHIFELYVWPTLEVMVTVYPGEIIKTLDSEVGIPLLAPCNGNSSC
ncbi:MAG: DUF296 domain-containing protein [Candidatus Dependentiae bacterium]|nr:DUF296 domain-containing protein [Candidatus Dependentiae bacterium]